MSDKKATPLQIGIIVVSLIAFIYLVLDILGYTDSFYYEEPIAVETINASKPIVSVEPPKVVPVETYQKKESITLAIDPNSMVGLREEKVRKTIRRDIAVLDAEIREATLRPMDQTNPIPNSHSVNNGVPTENVATPSPGGYPAPVVEVASGEGVRNEVVSEFEIAKIAQLSKNIQMLNVDGVYYRVHKGMAIGDFTVVKSDGHGVKLRNKKGKMKTLGISFPTVIQPVTASQLVETATPSDDITLPPDEGNMHYEDI